MSAALQECCPMPPTVHCSFADLVDCVQTGKITAENRIHDADIKDMHFSQDGTHFITASGDRTAKIVDTLDLQVMKEFAFERPANAADMSPIADHVSGCCLTATIFISRLAWCVEDHIWQRASFQQLPGPLTQRACRLVTIQVWRHSCNR